MRGYFVPQFPSGTMKVSIGYADNESIAVEVEIFLSPRDWSEIQEKPFYRELTQYLDSLRTQDSESRPHGQVNLEEKEGFYTIISP